MDGGRPRYEDGQQMVSYNIGMDITRWEAWKGRPRVRWSDRNCIKGNQLAQYRLCWRPLADAFVHAVDIRQADVDGDEFEKPGRGLCPAVAVVRLLLVAITSMAS